MKNFIVWDKSINRFIDPLKDAEIAISNTGDVFYISICFCAHTGYECIYEYSNHFLFFDDTGLKDINGKPIYADCSIFSFQHYNSTTPMQGYFIFDISTLSYKIFILSYNFNIQNVQYGQHWDYNNMSDFKIIDTIQENKLGLIEDL